MKISLLHNTPLHICARSIRTCWASEDKSDSYTLNGRTDSTKICPCCNSIGTIGINYKDGMLECNECGNSYNTNETICGPKDKALIERVGNKNKHSSVLRHLTYTFHMSGISTKTLLAFTRHKAGIDFSVQSTRYTTAKRANKLKFTKSEDSRIDSKLDSIMELVQQAISEGCSNDVISLLLPQAYEYTLVVTMNAQAIQHFLHLRTNPSAHKQIRELAYEIYDKLPSEHQYLFKDSMYKEPITKNCSTCYLLKGTPTKSICSYIGNGFEPQPMFSCSEWTAKKKD